jgi:hypothetical protein
MKREASLRFILSRAFHPTLNGGDLRGRKGEGEMARVLPCWRKRIFLIGMLILSAIPGTALTGPAEKPGLAILRFFVERVDDPARGAVICPLCKGVSRPGNFLPGAQNTMTRLLYERMEAMGTFTILPAERTEQAFSRSAGGSFELKPVPSAVQLGKELGVDFVFLGYLFRFQERIGSSIGVEKPASVGFDLHLVRVRDGKVAWTGKFDETQRPLSEDIRKLGTFLRRGAVWLTAGELASAGMSEILEKLPGVQELEQ